eukprot:3643684-Amphidinium_carterae.1
MLMKTLTDQEDVTCVPRPLAVLSPIQMPRDPALPLSSLTFVLDRARGRVMCDRASKSSARNPRSSMTACCSTVMWYGRPTGVSAGALVRTRCSRIPCSIWCVRGRGPEPSGAQSS